MRRLFIMILVLIFIVFFASGCTSPVKDDLISYINTKLPLVTHLEEEALTEYESIVTEENYSYQALYNSLNDSIIPKYSEFVQKLEAISVNTKEVEEIHKLYLQGANKQLETFISLKEGMEDRDNEKLDKSNELLKESKNYMDRYRDEVLILADKHGINYKVK